MNMKHVLIAGAAFFAWGTSAQATVLYNNLFANPGDGGGAAGIAASAGGPAADSFTAQNTTTGLNLQLMLSQSSLFDGSSFVVSLLSDNATSPGSVLVSTGPFLDTLSTNPTPIPISMPTASVVAGDRYWVEVSDGGCSFNPGPLTANVEQAGCTNTVDWSYAYDTSGPGVASEWNYYAGTVSDNSAGPFQMCVTDNPSDSCAATHAPEPASLSLLGFGIVGLAALRRRFRG